LAKTSLGLKFRALQSNRMLSGLLGVRVKNIDTWAWVIAGVLAGIAGLFMGNMVRLNPTVLTFLVIPALGAAIVGRLTSLSATVFGGLFIGVVESMTALVPDLSRYGSSTAFVVAILAIVWQQRKGIGLSRDNSHLE
jgi:branched-chain amino acid transport system permease protein